MEEIVEKVPDQQEDSDISDVVSFVLTTQIFRRKEKLETKA